MVTETQANKSTAFLVLFVKLQTIGWSVAHTGVGHVVTGLVDDLYVVVDNVQLVVKQVPLNGFLRTVSRREKVK